MSKPQFFYSETDTPRADMELWKKYFTGELYAFEGTHFFIQLNHEEMAGIIRDRMSRRNKNDI